MGNDAERAAAWWSTAIIDIEPNRIAVRGYPIESLIGSLSFAEMIWLMLRGERPRPEHAALFEAALVAAVDHGPQAPSIAIARMAMTCGIGINGAVASGLNVLGDVHGGAGQRCMETLQAIVARSAAENQTVEDAAAGHVRSALAAGEVLAGIGHRFHRLDPRSVRLLALLQDAAAAGQIGGLHARAADAMANEMSRLKGRQVALNIDGAFAAILCELGFPPILGRGVFLLSRAVGLCAHAYEQSQQGGRIKGPMPPEFGYAYAGVARREFP